MGPFIRNILNHLLIAMMVIAFGLSANAQDEIEPVDLPDNIAQKVAGLDQEKIDFLRGSGIFSFAGSHELLFDRFKNKSPEDVEAYIDAMMRVKELMKFDPETDMESIPLVGFELVELNPLVDPGYTSAQNANRILAECLTGIAMRKKGITDPKYLSPLTTEHGHDN